MSRSRTCLRRLPTGFCKYASVPTLGCDVFLHAALSWIGQRGNWLTKLIQCVIQQCNITYRELNFLVFLPHQFAMVEVMVTSLMDEFYQQLIAFFKRKEFFVLAVCGVAFLLGIPCVLQVNTHLIWLTFRNHVNSCLILLLLSRWASMFFNWWTITLP